MLRKKVEVSISIPPIYSRQVALYVATLIATLDGFIYTIKAVDRLYSASLFRCEEGLEWDSRAICWFIRIRDILHQQMQECGFGYLSSERRP